MKIIIKTLLATTHYLITTNSIVALLILGSCGKNNSITAHVAKSDCRPSIDGVADKCWENLPTYPINGNLVGDANWDGPNDLSAYFKVMQHDNDLIFLVKVLDDIEGKIESSTLSHYWENDNIEFFFTNGKKLNQESLTESDSIFCFNYNSPTNALLRILNTPDGDGNVELGRLNNDEGYTLEILFENELNIYDLSQDRIPFNIEVTDNDNQNLEEGFIKGRESGIAWGMNSARSSWMETANYGELIIE